MIDDLGDGHVDGEILAGGHRRVEVCDLDQRAEPEAGSEVIGRGGRESLGDRASMWAAGHRRWIRAAWVLAGAAVLGTAGMAGAKYLAGPPLPGLVAVHRESSTGEGEDAQWTYGADLRPSTPVIMGVPARLTVARAPADKRAKVVVLGLTGPGLVAPTPTPVNLPDGLPVTASVDTGLDCARAQIPAAADAYRLRLRVTRGGRTSDGLVPSGELGRWFSEAVTRTCGLWLARHDLTITAVAATVDPTEPTATVTVTVDNRGARPAWLAPLTTDTLDLTLHPASGPAGIARVSAPPGTSTFTATLHLHDCQAGSGDPSWLGARAASVTTWETMGLVGTVGSPTWQPGQPGATADAAPTGLVITRDAAAALAAAKNTICAGPHQFALAADPSRVRWDPRRRDLTATVEVRDLRGHFSGATLADSPKDARGGTLVTPPGSRYRSDKSRTRVALTLTYRVAATMPCPGAVDLSLPGPELLVDVPTTTRTRRVPLQVSLGWLLALTQSTANVSITCS